MAEILLAIINGTIWGLAVTLMALGLVLTFGFLRILNLAHGTFYMLGAVLAFYAVTRFNSFLLALLFVPVLIACLGFGLERWLLRPVQAVANADVLITFAVAMVVEYGVLIGFGGAPRRIPYPIGMSIRLFGSNYPVYRLVVAIVSFLLLVCTVALVEKTRFGLYVRATYQDIELARGLGIPVNWVMFLTFGLGCAYAAAAGIMLAPLVGIDFQMGTDIMAMSFVVTIIGGLTRIPTIALVAVLTELAENLLAIWVNPIMTRGILLLSLFCALAFIYGRSGRTRLV
jgi:branched-chain amino acid transport system permease protein